MRKTLDEVLAENAIRDLQMCYCRAVDRWDWDLLRSCFHPDATTDYGFFGGPLDDFIGMTQQALKAYRATTHITGNQLVKVNGNSAWAEHYAVASHRVAADDLGPERDLVTAIRYIDRLECRDGDWRISHRALVLDWARTDPLPPIEGVPQLHLGKRGHEDMSYRDL